MTEQFFVETALIVLGIVSFVTLLVGAMVIITALRQHRADRLVVRAVRQTLPTNDEIVTEPALPVGFAALRAALRTTQTVAIVPESDIIPDWMRLPVREAAPDQIVIQIEPDNAVSPQKRNIQRLIAHLEAQKAASQTAQVS